MGVGNRRRERVFAAPDGVQQDIEAVRRQLANAARVLALETDGVLLVEVERVGVLGRLERRHRVSVARQEGCVRCRLPGGEAHLLQLGEDLVLHDLPRLKLDAGSDPLLEPLEDRLRLGGAGLLVVLRLVDGEPFDLGADVVAPCLVRLACVHHVVRQGDGDVFLRHAGALNLLLGDAEAFEEGPALDAGHVLHVGLDDGGRDKDGLLFFASALHELDQLIRRESGELGGVGNLNHSLDDKDSRGRVSFDRRERKDFFDAVSYKSSFDIVQVSTRSGDLQRRARELANELLKGARHVERKPSHGIAQRVAASTRGALHDHLGAHAGCRANGWTGTPSQQFDRNACQSE